MKRKIYVDFLIILLVSVLSGCMLFQNTEQSNSTPAMYHSYRLENNEWCVGIGETQYVLWPDQNWILINEEADQFIGHVDSERTSLYTIKNDPDMRFLHVSEWGADALHVPLVKRELVPEFSLQEIDGIEWARGGIHAEYLPDTLGQNVMRDKTRVKEFIELVKNLSDKDTHDDWKSAGCIYCFNDALPGAVSIYDMSYYKETIKLSGRNTFRYVLIPRQQLERILGYKLEI